MNRLDTIRNSGTPSHCHGMQFVANFTGGRLQLLSLPRAKEQKAYREIPGLLHCTVNLHNTSHSLAAEREILTLLTLKSFTALGSDLLLSTSQSHNLLRIHLKNGIFLFTAAQNMTAVPDIPANAGFLRDKAVVFRNTTKETPCNIQPLLSQTSNYEIFHRFNHQISRLLVSDIFYITSPELMSTNT